MATDDQQPKGAGDGAEAGRGKGVWAGGRWVPARRPPTEAELARHEAELRRPIYVENRLVRGYRCDDCDHWFQVLPYNPDKPRGWRLRYGCPECGSKSLTACSAVPCQRCGGLVTEGEGEDHAEVCGG